MAEKEMEKTMNTNCKRWKYLLFIVVVITAFASIPFTIKAADSAVAIMDGTRQKQEAISDKMDSTDKTIGVITTAGAASLLDLEITGESTVVTTAGAANLLDADYSKEFSKEKERVVALAKSNSASKTAQESTLVMAKVNQYVNIRQEADQNSVRLGVLYKDCGGEIIEKTAEWTKITSGDVTGWVKNDYLYFGKEAEQQAKEVGILIARSNTETLRVRKGADTSASVIGLLSTGEALEAIAEEGDWVKVSYEGTTGYVAANYVKVTFDIDKAETIEVVKAREAAELERAKAKAEADRELAAAKNRETINAQKEAVFATASELDILAALIQCEAGGEPYEGQVAVGAVVMNRVRCGGYPNTITEVIYQSGQFAPASKGKMESLILNNTTNASCRQAAQEAINGRCNVGDALHFRRVGNKQGLIIGNHVFW